MEPVSVPTGMMYDLHFVNDFPTYHVLRVGEEGNGGRATSGGHGGQEMVYKWTLT